MKVAMKLTSYDPDMHVYVYTLYLGDVDALSRSPLGVSMSMFHFYSGQENSTIYLGRHCLYMYIITVDCK
jgi:hypothetical protein